MTGTERTLTDRLKEYISQNGDATFETACRRFVFTEIAALISTLPFGGEMWLKSRDDLARLSYYLKDDEHSITPAVILAGICEGSADWPRIFGRQVPAYFAVDGEIISDGRGEKKAELSLTVTFDDIRIPILMTVERIPSDEMYPRKEAITMLLDETRVYDVPMLSPEDRVADGLYRIFSLLELLFDADVFYEVYRLIESEPLQGRKISDYFSTRIKENGVRLSDGAWDLWKSYRNYVYMKRKWSAVQKRHGIKSSSWEEVHDKLSLFAHPIYCAAMKDELFWGDWMPELSRYLD